MDKIIMSISIVGGLSFGIFVLGPACDRLSAEDAKVVELCETKCAPRLVYSSHGDSCVCSERIKIKK